MAYFQTKNPNSEGPLEGLAMEVDDIFYGRWSILLTFGLFYCHLVYFTAIWYIYFEVSWIFWYFGIFFSIWYVWSRNICHPCWKQGDQMRLWKNRPTRFFGQKFIHMPKLIPIYITLVCICNIGLKLLS
jgi:hypothetical protein